MHTDRQTNRQTDKQADRPVELWLSRLMQTYRQTGTGRH